MSQAEAQAKSEPLLIWLNSSGQEARAAPLNKARWAVNTGVFPYKVNMINHNLIPEYWFRIELTKKKGQRKETPPPLAGEDIL